MRKTTYTVYTLPQKDQASSTKNTRGFGILETLTVVLVVLKLCDVITCSWWIVFSPLLVPFALLLCVLVVAILFAE